MTEASAGSSGWSVEVGHDEGRARHGVGHDAAAEAEDPAHEVLRHELGRRPGRDEPAVAQGHDVVGVARREVEVVQHHDDRRAMPSAQVTQQVEHVDLVGDVEEGGRLVEQDDIGLLREGQGDPDPLPLTAGQLLDVPVGELDRAGGAHGSRDGGVVLVGPPAHQGVVRVATAAHQVDHGDSLRQRRALGQQRHAAGELLGPERPESSVPSVPSACRHLLRPSARRCRTWGAAAGRGRAAPSTCRTRWGRR